MATWKKVLVSGSAANLTTLQVDNLTSGLVTGNGTGNLTTTAVNGTGNIVATTGASGLSHSGSFSGSFQGDGSALTGVTATAIFPTTLQTTLASTDKVYVNDGSNKYATVAQFNSSSWTGITGDILVTNLGVATIQPNSVALGTDTTGNYVGDVTAGAGLTKTSTASEGQTVDLAIGAGTHITVNPDDVAVNTTTLVPAITGSIYTGITGDVTITSAGVSAIGTGKVTSTMILDGTIVNNDINASAAIAYTKISFAGSSLVSASVLSSGAQGEVVLTTNGVAGSTVDLGLQTTDSPSFAGATLTGNLAINNGTSTAITTTGTTVAVFNTNATTVNAFGAATTLNIGAGSGTTTVGNNLVVTGDLFVNGNTTQVNTTELLVEDKFILLASGSATAGDGGIVIDRGSDVNANVAFGFDSATARWGFQNGLTDTTNAMTIGTNGNSAFAGVVFTEAAHTATKPTTGEFVVAGAIYTNTDGTIWMYS